VDMEITEQDICHLRDEAAMARDEDMAQICRIALRDEPPTDQWGNLGAWAECERVITEAADAAREH